jgi:hypothetical protein
MTRARENADHYAGSTSASDLDSGTLPAARLPLGSVLQVVHNFSTTEVTTSTGTGVVAVAHSILTSNATNKVLAIVGVNIAQSGGTSAQKYAGLTLECSEADTVTYGPYDGTGYFGIRANFTSSIFTHFTGYYHIQQLFEPDYEGTITVTAKAHSYTGAGTTVDANDASTINGRSHITLMEIAST